MIDENLCRAELSPAERASQTARRKAIYIELHPETAAGRAGAEARWNASDNLSFASATAEATGKSAKSVERDASRGENVCDEALRLVRGTSLGTGPYLDRLKKVEALPRRYVPKQKPRRSGGASGLIELAGDQPQRRAFTVVESE